MTTKINKKITGIGIHKEPEKSGSDIEHMHEKVERPEMLVGSTYKIKPPVSEHAMYITINDIVLNSDTEHEMRRPFEIFINSKSMEHFMWVLALTRVISAVFRKGGDISFLVEELKAVFDPNGGYFKPGGQFMPSLVAEIAQVIERHLITIGLLEPEELSVEQQRYLAKKKQQYIEETNEDLAEGGFPSSATLCSKCMHKSVVKMDGCLTCLNCGDSKCG